METNQSATDKSKLKASDLQVAKYNSGFGMVHKMTLATFTLSTKSDVQKTRYYISGPTAVADENYIWYDELVSVTNSSSFISAAKPYYQTSIYYYIAKSNSSTATTISAEATALGGTAKTIADDGSKTNEWNGSVPASSAPNTCIDISPSAPSMAYITYSGYAIQLGDIYYSDGAVSRPSSKYSNKTAIGILAYIGKDWYTEKDYGGGHALVLALTDESSTTRVFLPSNNWMYDTPNITNVYDLATMKNASSGYLNCYVYVTNLTNSNYPAFYYAIYNNGLAYPTPKGPGGRSTGWFLPSCSQWYRILANPGIGNYADASVTYNSYFDSGRTAVTRINNALTTAGGTSLSSLYWTSNDKETNGSDAVNILFNSSGILIGEGAGNYHSYPCYVRSMIAF